MKILKSLRHLILAFGMFGSVSAQTTDSGVYGKQAAEVTEYLQKNFWDRKTGLYAAAIDKKTPDFMWGSGVMFSALAGATRHDPKYKSIMRKFFEGMDANWDTKVKIPGYEAAPTAGGGTDKYYDDNAWMVITFLEAYDVTGENHYLKRAGETLDFVMSGWDEQGGGGIWWHQRHLGNGKNTCANAPAAVGCFRISKFSDPKTAEARIADGGKIVKWTTANLRGSNGLFGDSLDVVTGKKNMGQLTYNSALMLRAYLSLYALTGQDVYLDEAEVVGKAADGMLDKSTGAYRDPIKWSHLMVEADIELFRWTKNDRYMKRAKANCDFHYAEWKKSPPSDLIANASLARELWLMADMETDAGRTFLKKSDRLRK
ncbi:MAG: glycoside hydrolase family 76 protein [Luteolibacter sp.]|uniref:glycoside hydrolase family 76 protein n=1 Tax=Luteolibacter sp. TaxID=1962973 RepID=UPI00326773E8